MSSLGRYTSPKPSSPVSLFCTTRVKDTPHTKKASPHGPALLCARKKPQTNIRGPRRRLDIPSPTNRARGDRGAAVEMRLAPSATPSPMAKVIFLGLDGKRLRQSQPARHLRPADPGLLRSCHNHGRSLPVRRFQRAPLPQHPCLEQLTPFGNHHAVVGCAFPRTHRGLPSRHDQSRRRH